MELSIPNIYKEHKVKTKNLTLIKNLIPIVKNQLIFYKAIVTHCGDSLKNANCKDMEFKYLGDDRGKQYYYGVYLLMNSKNDNDSSYFVIYEARKEKNIWNLFIFYFWKEDIVIMLRW